jgi:hypothetical protein
MGHEVDAEALGYAKDPLAVRHMLEHLLAQPLPELDDPFLMTGWAEMPALKGKAHKRYEFGCKVSVAATSRGGWFVGAMAKHEIHMTDTPCQMP